MSTRLLKITFALVMSLALGFTVFGQPAFHETERGPHHRVTVRGDGKPSSHRVVEMATGMHFWNGSDWAPSEASFDDTEQGFLALRSQHKVRLLPDLNARGSVTMQTPDGINLFSTPLAIALYDAKSGTFQVIGTLTNTAGVLIGTNQVWYANAFCGVCADIVYTISQDSAEQDILLTAKLDPQDYGFPRDTTRIQIFTEFYQEEQPEITREPAYLEQNQTIRNQMVSPDLIDSTLMFGGSLRVAGGSAYTSPSEVETNGVSAPVVKDYQTIDGRTFLIEQVQFSSLSSGLLSLPDCQPPGGQGKLQGKSFNGYAAIPKAPAKRVQQARAKSSGRLAKAPLPKRPNVTIDYRATLVAPTTVLQADTTYVITNAYSCSSLTLEGGTVAKYKVGASIQANLIVCKTGQYRPAVFTSVDDDSAGESMNGFTGSGYTGTNNASGYANPCLAFPTGNSVSNCRFCYAQAAIANSQADSTFSVTANHSQFIKCLKAISLTTMTSGSGSSAPHYPAWANFTFNNTLFTSVQTPITVGGAGFSGFTFTVSHSTFDHVGSLWSGGTCTNFTSYNSIYANITNSSTPNTSGGANNGFYSSAQTVGTSQLSLTNWPFQSVGAGNYYLTDSSGCRNYGATSGPPASLFTDLKSRTTYPPLVVASTIWSTDQSLTPQAQRDTDLPDIGYHYDPLDYELGFVLATNCAVSFSNSVAIGTFATNAASGGNYGLGIGTGASLNSVGIPNRPNWVAVYNTVQEQPITSWTQPTNGSVISEFQNLSASAGIYARFTQWSVLSQSATHFYGPTNSGPFNFQDCEFHGGKLTTYRPTVNLTNCLLERTYTDMEPKDGLTTAVRNCLVLGANFTFGATNAQVNDTLFDKPAITNWGGYAGTNAYITNFTRLVNNCAYDKLLSASPSYQVGTLGRYYHPTNSPLIINVGTTTADIVGLYHYTLTTNMVGGYQIKETNSVVDIGYHYVAVDTNGVPIDTDGDGVPDYLEDVNGDGSASGDPTSWQSSQNGTTGVNGLQVFTPLK